MKVKRVYYIFAALFLLTAAVPVRAGWRLYDNFDAGVIDPALWNKDESSADIEIDAVEGAVKFTHKSGFPNDSSWLTIRQNPETVSGLRATVRIESCTGDVRARIGGDIGKLGDNLAFSALQMQPARTDVIFASANLYESTPPFSTVWDYFYGQFRDSTAIIGTAYELTLVFTPNRVIARVAGLGEIVYTSPFALSPPDAAFVGLGTRSSTGEGPCVVYYDDVYVYEGEICEGDNNTDGDVDGSDLAVFARDFGRTDCP